LLIVRLNIINGGTELVQIFKVIFLSAIGIFIIILAVYYLAWKRPGYFLEVKEAGETGNFVTIANQNHPYVHEQDNLIVFNGADIRNPNDLQIKQLVEKWESLKPDIVLIEGTLGFFLPGIMNPVKKFGIAGLAYELAERNNAKIYSFDLPVEKIVDKLLKKYSSEQVALSLALHSYIENRKNEKSYSNDEFLREYLSKLRFLDLNASVKSVRDIDKIWERDFTKLKNWRAIDSFPGYIGEITIEINLIKNKHLACLINHFTGLNKKVMVINNSDTLLVVQNK
jgi:hypothetical protein